MARLGINQELEVLFNRVLNKPEHQETVHYCGNFAFTFHRVKKVVRHADSYFMDCQYSLLEQDRLYFSIATLPIEGFYGPTLDGDFKDIPDVIGRLYGDDKSLFRDALTKYLKMLELTDKLKVSTIEGQPARNSTRKI